MIVLKGLDIPVAVVADLVEKLQRHRQASVRDFSSVKACTKRAGVRGLCHGALRISQATNSEISAVAPIAVASDGASVVSMAVASSPRVKMVVVSFRSCI